MTPLARTSEGAGVNFVQHLDNFLAPLSLLADPSLARPSTPCLFGHGASNTLGAEAEGMLGGAGQMTLKPVWGSQSGTRV